MVPHTMRATSMAKRRMTTALRTDSAPAPRYVKADPTVGNAPPIYTHE
jgi:hypothetical protein